MMGPHNTAWDRERFRTVLINNYKVNALLDTGADLNVMSRYLVDKCNIKIDYSRGKVRIDTKGGANVSYMTEKVIVKRLFSDKSIETTFYLLEDDYDNYIYY